MDTLYGAAAYVGHKGSFGALVTGKDRSSVAFWLKDAPVEKTKKFADLCDAIIDANTINKQNVGSLSC